MSLRLRASAVVAALLALPALLSAQQSGPATRALPSGGSATVRGDTLVYVGGPNLAATTFIILRDTVEMLVPIPVLDSVFSAPARPQFARTARAIHAAVVRGESPEDAVVRFVTEFQLEPATGPRNAAIASGARFQFRGDTVLWVRQAPATDTIWFRVARDSAEVLRPGPRRPLPPVFSGALRMLIQSAIDAAEVERLLEGISR